MVIFFYSREQNRYVGRAEVKMRKTKRIIFFCPFKMDKLFVEGGAIAPNGPPQLRHWTAHLGLPNQVSTISTSHDSQGFCGSIQYCFPWLLKQSYEKINCIKSAVKCISIKLMEFFLVKRTLWSLVNSSFTFRTC